MVIMDVWWGAYTGGGLGKMRYRGTSLSFIKCQITPIYRELANTASPFIDVQIEISSTHSDVQNWKTKDLHASEDLVKNVTNREVNAPPD